MSTFDQLVKDAQPALADDGAFATVTEGMSWDFGVIVQDAAGEEYDMPALMEGGSAECKALDGIDGTVLVTFSVTFPGGGEIRWTATPSDTAGKGGTATMPKQARWYMTLTNAAGRKAAVFNAQNSQLSIEQG